MENKLKCPVCPRTAVRTNHQDVVLVVEKDLMPDMNVIAIIKCKHCGSQVAIVQKTTEVAA